MVVSIPGLRLDVTPNARLHWATRARLVKDQRSTTALVLATWRRTLPALPVVVTVTRCSPGTMDDDNATASAKAVRDAVADVLGVDDRDPRVTWRVLQKRAPWGVEIAIEPRGDALLALGCCPSCGVDVETPSLSCATHEAVAVVLAAIRPKEPTR